MRQTNYVEACMLLSTFAVQPAMCIPSAMTAAAATPADTVNIRPHCRLQLLYSATLTMMQRSQCLWGRWTALNFGEGVLNCSAATAHQHCPGTSTSNSQRTHANYDVLLKYLN